MLTFTLFTCLELEGFGAELEPSAVVAVDVVGMGLVDVARSSLTTPFARMSNVFARTRLKKRLFMSTCATWCLRSLAGTPFVALIRPGRPLIPILIRKDSLY